MAVYINDVLVTGKMEKEHLAALEEVLEDERSWTPIEEREVCLPSSLNCVLGHGINTHVHLVAEKLQALQEAHRPKNVAELKSYLGLLTYYAKFLPNLSTVLAPLYKLLKHQEP